MEQAVLKYIEKYPDTYLACLLQELKEENCLQDAIVTEEIDHAKFDGKITEKEISDFFKLWR